MSMPAASIDAEIAARIRHLRAARGLTLDALARQATVSRAMLSRVERGESSPTAQLLAKVCDGLGTTLASLFADAAAPASPLARCVDQPVWRDPGSGYLRRSVSPPNTGSAVDMAQIEFPPGATVHFDNTGAAGTDQHIWVLDGTLELNLDGEPVRLGPGDCLWMPLDRPLRFHNPAPYPVRYLVVVSNGRAQ